MTAIATIVEGDGEVQAFPLLLRRLIQWRRPDIYVDVLRPIRVRRDSFLNKEREFSRHLALAAQKCGKDGLVLVLLDADDACPKVLGSALATRMGHEVSDVRVGAVLANREYEAWFIAAASSLHGHHGFQCPDADAHDPEGPRDAKGWVKARTGTRRYDPIIDQPAFSALMDLDLAYARSRSFRKLCSELDRFLNTL